MDANLIAVAGIALWLGGAYAFTEVVRDWSAERRTRNDRRRSLAGRAR
jgi:hypothetical protein